MKKKLPFEEAIERKLQQAALPDKEQSWQAMEILLNKKKKRRGAFFFTGYPLLLLLLLLGTTAWLLFNRQEEKKTGISQKENSVNTGTAKENNTAQAGNNRFEKTNEENTTPSQKNEIDTKNNNATVQTNNKAGASNLQQSSNNNSYSNTIQPPQKRRHITKGKTTANTFSSVPYQEDDAGNPNDKSNSSEVSLQKPGIISKKEDATINDDNTGTDPLQDTGNNKNTLLANSVNTTDSSVKTRTSLKTDIKTDTNNLKKAGMVKSATLLEQKNGSKKFSWSAGIAIQQPIPVDGQKITKYGFNGSSNMIDNYIPSVYVRWQKKNKWFIQAEFGYGTPRPVAEFAYSRTTEVNGTSTEISTSTLKLKKTYYHEIPVSFNYYIQKNWSVGAGVMYGILHRSVTEKEQAIKNIQNQQETRSSNIVSSGFTDSFLYKKQYHWLLQTNYEWKKLSFGIRYSKDVLPYIKYTSPSGELNKQKNQTLGFIISLRLGQ